MPMLLCDCQSCIKESYLLTYLVNWLMNCLVSSDDSVKVKVFVSCSYNENFVETDNEIEA